MRKVELNATAYGATAREALANVVADLVASLADDDSAPIVWQAHVVATPWPDGMRPIRAKRFEAQGKLILLRAVLEHAPPSERSAATEPTSEQLLKIRDPSDTDEGPTSE